MKEPRSEPPNAAAPSRRASSVSSRRRRLRWAVAMLVCATLVGSALGIWIYLNSRPEQYRPDEKAAGITAALARNIPAEAPRPRFTDVTAASGLAGFRTFVGDRTSQLPEDMGPGMAWGDFNNNGFEDLFLVSAGGPLGTAQENLAPSELYENLGDGTFRKVERFPEVRIHGMAAAWGDYDGDGFLDLIVTGYNTLLLFRNEGGTGQFTPDARFPNLKGFWAGASWGDYNNDRALDLYICGYVQYVEDETDMNQISEQIGTAVPYSLNPASYEGERNLFFHNNGDGTFTEKSAELGIINREGKSLAALWHDFDDDGWLDLYVANDISDNVFYRNIGGRFEDISHPAYVADYRSAMGLAAGDFDRDGDDDLFVTHWVAQENGLYENMWADFNVRGRGPASAAPGGQPSPSGAAFVSAPDSGSAAGISPPKAFPLRFIDIADRKGLGQHALAYVGWGTEFVDLDGDGWLDIILANGNTLEFPGPPPKKLKPQEPFLYWNKRGEHFYDIAPLHPGLSEQHVSRGLAVADYDNDGAMDFIIAQLGGGVQLFRNEMQTGNWIKIRLRSRTPDGAPLGFGDGSKVIAHVNGAGLRRTVSSVSYLSQSSRVLHFGLGTAERVERLEVRWHAGETNVFLDLAANAAYELTEGDQAPKRIPVSTTHLARKIAAASPLSDRGRILEFWSKHRGGMDAMKIEKDPAKAIRLFREALAIDPAHEDARFYLGICLAGEGEADEALVQFDLLRQLKPQSLRAWQQYGVIRALSSSSPGDYEAAEHSLQRAHALNPEETGVLLVLGELAVLRGDFGQARRRFAAACQTNPKAVPGFFLQGYMAWKNGDGNAATDFLEQTRVALGPDWHPEGASSEGDVKEKQHVDLTPLSRFWSTWNGALDPASSYASLDAYLSRNQ
jgi:enediyne biosynthesis protein E4